MQAISYEGFTKSLNNIKSIFQEIVSIFPEATSDKIMEQTLSLLFNNYIELHTEIHEILSIEYLCDFMFPIL